MKKISKLALLLCLAISAPRLTTAAASNVLFFGLGPASFTLDTLETYRYKDDPELQANYRFKIDNSEGLAYLLFPFFEFKKYLIPFGLFYGNVIRSGSGSLTTFNTKQNTPTELIEHHDFKPTYNMFYVGLGNGFHLFERNVSNRPLNLYYLLGYNYQRSKLVARWEDDASFAHSVWKGAFMGLLGLYQLPHSFSLILAGYFYPDRLNVHSSRNSLAGEAPGFQSYKYFEAGLFGSLLYKFKENKYLGLSVGWFPGHNVGSTMFRLSPSQDIYTNPRLHYLKGRTLYLLFTCKLEF